MTALDTNVILRLLTHDDPGQMAALAKFFAAHPGESYFVPDIVLVEAVWTLRSAFGWKRNQIAVALRRLAAKPDVDFGSRDGVHAAIVAMEAGGDFADQLIVSAAQEHGCTRLATFDAELAARHPELAVQPK